MKAANHYLWHPKGSLGSKGIDTSCNCVYNFKKSEDNR